MSRYCEVKKDAFIETEENEIAKIEKIVIHKLGREELRFSWWKNGRFMLRPLDLEEEKWVKLFDAAVQNGVVSQEFIKDMIAVLQKGLKE